MKETIGWGIIGPGRIAKQFADSLKLLPNAKVTAVGSRSVERAKEFTDVYGGIPYGSYEEMVRCPDVDIVYVATPHPMHEEHVILSANAGKAILCEKPFTVTYKAAVNMIEAAKRNNVFIMEGLWSRFFPIWKKAIEVINEGIIGDVQIVNSAMGWGANSKLREDDPNDRLYSKTLAGGGLLDAGAYVLSAAFYIMKGKVPSEVYSVANLCGSGVDDDMGILFKYEDPTVIAQLHCGLRSVGTDTKIVGSNGTITIFRSRNPERMTISSHGYRSRREETFEMSFPSFGFQFEAEEAMNCLIEGKKECSITPWQETLDIARISEDIRHRANVWYPFEDGPEAK